MHHISKIICNFAAEWLRDCSRSAIDASIMALAKPQPYHPKIKLSECPSGRLQRHTLTSVREIPQI